MEASLALKVPLLCDRIIKTLGVLLRMNGKGLFRSGLRNSVYTKAAEQRSLAVPDQSVEELYGDVLRGGRDGFVKGAFGRVSPQDGPDLSGLDKPVCITYALEKGPNRG